MSPKKDMETHNNLLMINTMKQFGNLLWYTTHIDVNDFVIDQPLWKILSQKTRLKITWLKENWRLLRGQYLHDRQETLKDPSIQRTKFLEKYGEHLSFLESNAEEWATLLRGGGSSQTNKIEANYNDTVCNSGDCGNVDQKGKFHDAKRTIKRSAIEIEDTDAVFLKAIECKLQKLEPTEKERMKKEILDMFKE